MVTAHVTSNDAATIERAIAHVMDAQGLSKRGDALAFLARNFLNGKRKLRAV